MKHAPIIRQKDRQTAYKSVYFSCKEFSNQNKNYKNYFRTNKGIGSGFFAFLEELVQTKKKHFKFILLLLTIVLLFNIVSLQVYGSDIPPKLIANSEETLNSAIAEINANPSTKYRLEIQSNITITSDKTIKDGKAHIVASGGDYTINSIKGNRFKLENSANVTFGEDNASNTLTLTLGNGASFYAIVAGFPYANTSLGTSTLTIEDGVKITGKNGVGGVSSATINMYGGEITGNTVSNSGSGVYLDHSATFNMYDGDITNNKTTAGVGGGGFYARANAKINIYGGEISSNTASTSQGNAIYLEGSASATISDNPKIIDNGDWDKQIQGTVTYSELTTGFELSATEDYYTSNTAQFGTSSNHTTYFENNTIKVKTTKIGDPFSLSFDAQEGTPVPEVMTVNYQKAIGTLPTVSKAGFAFGGWYIDDTKITSTTVWDYSVNKTAIAKWIKEEIVTTQAELKAAIADTTTSKIVIGSDIALTEPIILSNGTIKTIVSNGDYTISAENPLYTGTAQRFEVTNGTLILGENGASNTLTISTGNRTTSASILVNGSNAKLKLYDGASVSNGTNIALLAGAKFDMYGGKITNNKGSYAGAITLFNGSGTSFTMYGGIIEENNTVNSSSSYAKGGGAISVQKDCSNSKVSIKGGTIRNNTSYAGVGDAIYFWEDGVNNTLELSGNPKILAVSERNIDNLINTFDTTTVIYSGLTAGAQIHVPHHFTLSCTVSEYENYKGCFIPPIGYAPKYSEGKLQFAFDPNYKTVTFDVDGTKTEIKVEQNTVIPHNRIPAPTKDGYSLTWNKEDGVEWISSDSITTDITLTAKWTEVTRTVELDVSKGNITINDNSFSGFKTDGTTLTGNHTSKTTYKIIGTTVNKYAAKIEGSSDKNIILNNVSITTGSIAPLSISNTGKTTITLEGTNTLTVKGGIAGALQTSGNNASEVIINGSGTLNATSYNGAAIGTAQDVFGGTIKINSGTIHANSTLNGAGIGTGRNSTETEHSNTTEIIINGGTVTATSSIGAGIGGGARMNGGIITINGGTVHASSTNTSGYAGAGIGGGAQKPSSPFNGGAGGTISIMGGNITATSINGDAIGAGSNANNNSDKIGTLTVADNMTINASSQKGNLISATTGHNIIVNNDGNYEIYGDITLQSDLIVDTDKSLILGLGASLNLGGYTLTNNGVIINKGTIIGTPTGSGTILNYLEKTWSIKNQKELELVIKYAEDNDTVKIIADISIEADPDSIAFIVDKPLHFIGDNGSATKPTLILNGVDNNSNKKMFAVKATDGPTTFENLQFDFAGYGNLFSIIEYGATAIIALKDTNLTIDNCIFNTTDQALQALRFAGKDLIFTNNHVKGAFRLSLHVEPSIDGNVQITDNIFEGKELNVLLTDYSHAISVHTTKSGATVDVSRNIFSGYHRAIATDNSKEPANWTVEYNVFIDVDYGFEVNETNDNNKNIDLSLNYFEDINGVGIPMEVTADGGYSKYTGTGLGLNYNNYYKRADTPTIAFSSDYTRLLGFDFVETGIDLINLTYTSGPYYYVIAEKSDSDNLITLHEVYKTGSVLPDGHIKYSSNEEIDGISVTEIPIKPDWYGKELIIYKKSIDPNIPNGMLETMPVNANALLDSDVAININDKETPTTEADDEARLSPIYKIAFNTKGGSENPANQYKKSGEIWVEPTVPSKSGYVFGGWYESNDNGLTLTDKWDFRNPITKNTNLYAKWSDKPIIPPTNPTPDTGDNSNVWLYFILALVSLVGLVFTFYKKRKEQN